MEVIRFIQSICLIYFLTLHLAFALNKQANTPPPVDWQFFSLADVWHGFQGGLNNKTSYLGTSDLRMELDLEQLWHWHGYSALIEGQNLNGLRPNLFYVQSLQGFDNYEYDRLSTMTYLYQLWLQKQIGERWSVLYGFYDLNAEFNITDSSTLFILPSFQTSTELAQTGPNGPSVYPLIGLAGRVKYVPIKKLYFQGAIFDAAAANPFNRAYPHAPYTSGYGLLGIYEMGYVFLDKKDGSPQGKLALAFWGYDHKIPVQGIPGITDPFSASKTYGYYLLADYPFYVDTTVKKSIRGFVRYGIAKGEFNNFNKALSAGITFSGFIPSRKDDVFGIGLAPAWTSAQSRIENKGIGNGEFQYEVTYSFVVADWLMVQPDFIYISYPGGADREFWPNDLIIGGRVTIHIDKIQDKL